MFMPSSSSALQHQYINDDTLANSSTFADDELAESLGGYGSLGMDPFSYSNANNSAFGFNSSDRNPSGNGIAHRATASTEGKSFPMRLQTQNPLSYAASPSDFTSFSPDYGSPAPIPFNRQARPGQLTSMSMPQFGGPNHAAIMIGAGSLTASPSTPGFVGNSFGGYGEMEGTDMAKYLFHPAQS